ncbi:MULTISPECIES: hypothetical protein [Streptococcus]|uniref:Uncharacterized protein n=3 Tax=Streptococcus TaxID=1301 RepID=A0AA47FCQ4_STRMC|nr:MULTISPECIES: hypothetical protein [Streptococcus]MCQ8267661.1 hypothetical protein [Streptococcus suis]SUN57960.1 Uncharacterised protein [Streptococcus gallolyticus]MBZ5770027.1 hypothetical protein [Streptococcus thermophilus]MBZ5813552.1 hypothetical protein [Streptococcus thermophilus]MCE2058172.1 hypothetical protein [Streptococcus thermophilus]
MLKELHLSQLSHISGGSLRPPLYGIGTVKPIKYPKPIPIPKPILPPAEIM